MTTSIRFEVIKDWEKIPDDPSLQHTDVLDVAVDSQDRVYLHTRDGSRVSVYDKDGNFLHAWGDGVFGGAHGITIGPDDSVYCTDNRDHVIRKFTTDGTLLQTIGDGTPSDTGWKGWGGAPPKIHVNETVTRSAGPFCACCNLSVAPNGDLYVADGYGNARVHRFSPDGELIRSWGEVGTGKGEFHVVHGIVVTRDGKVVVCDRENDRLQFFTLDGEYVDMWTDVQRPCAIAEGKDGLLYVAELWRPVEPGEGSFVHGFAPHDLPGRVSVYATDGTVVARFGASTTDRSAWGNFIAPHGICLDSEDNLYVAEVTGIYAIAAGRMGPEVGWHQIQKFHRV